MAKSTAPFSRGYLTGSLLIATPLIRESCFERSVIYIVSHDEQSASGIVINHVFDNLHYDEVFEQLKIKANNKVVLKKPVHFGGPVHAEMGFVLHTVPSKEEHGPREIRLSSTLETLEKLAHGDGDQEAILALGYAGWEAGQLEKEILSNQWIVVPATPDLIFKYSKNHSKWEETAGHFGIDLARYSQQSGHA